MSSWKPEEVKQWLKDVTLRLSNIPSTLFSPMFSPISTEVRRVTFDRNALEEFFQKFCISHKANGKSLISNLRALATIAEAFGLQDNSLKQIAKYILTNSMPPSSIFLFFFCFSFLFFFFI